MRPGRKKQEQFVQDDLDDLDDMMGGNDLGFNNAEDDFFGDNNNDEEEEFLMQGNKNKHDPLAFL